MEFSVDPVAFLNGFREEPYVLLFGQGFDVDAPGNRGVVDLPWNLAATSQEGEFLKAFSQDGRSPRRISRREEDAVNSSALDRKQLKIIQLFSAGDAPDMSAALQEKRARQDARRMLDKLSGLLKHAGCVAVAGWTPRDRLDEDLLNDFLLSMRPGSVAVFGADAVPEGGGLAEAIEYQRHVHVAKELSEFLGAERLDPEEADEEEEDGGIHIFLHQRRCSIPRRELEQAGRFAKLLTVEEIGEADVPQDRMEQYFYRFLRDSPFLPQWYGYRNGFHLVRDYEEELHKKVLHALQRPGSLKAQAICLAGQSGSGKTIAMGSLAYRIFAKREFPVIRIVGEDLNFSGALYEQRGQAEFEPSAQFRALEQLVHALEDRGARSVLILWDRSAYDTHEARKCVNLYRHLRSSGRNVQLVFSAYGIKAPDCDRIDVDISLRSPGETDRFQKLLEEKAHMAPAIVQAVMASVSSGGQSTCNFMTLLYRAFDVIRHSLEKNLQREAVKCIDSAVRGELEEFSRERVRTDIEEAFAPFLHLFPDVQERQSRERLESVRAEAEELLKIVAVCTKFRLAVPADMAYRILEELPSEAVRAIAGLPFFVFREMESGDFSFEIRTALEAEMLLRSFMVQPGDEADIIVRLLQILRGGDAWNRGAEIGLVTTLLMRIGPNADDKQTVETYEPFYPAIVEALKEFRETKGIDPRLALQEISYMREMTGSDAYDMDGGERERTLRAAIRIGTEAISTAHGVYSIYDKLAIEVAHSRTRLGQLVPSETSSQCALARRDALRVIQHDPDNRYAYPALLWAAIHEYDWAKENGDLERCAGLLAAYGEFAERIRSEGNPDLVADRYFIDPVQELYRRMDDESVSKDYFDSLLEKGISAGIYLEARNRIRNAGIDIYAGAEELTDGQAETCEKVCADLLQNKDYERRTDLAISPSCQRMLLRLKWMQHNRRPVFCGQEQRTGIGEEGWRDMRDICRRYAEDIYRRSGEPHAASQTVLYVLALCEAQLGDFAACKKWLDAIREESMKSFDRSRLVPKHILCNPEGAPLEFYGEFVSGPVPGNADGLVKLEKIPYKIIYYKEGIRDGIDRSIGSGCKGFQVGVGFTGLRAYHGLAGKRGS